MPFDFTRKVENSQTTVEKEVEKEVWKAVVGYEGFYKVSSFGRIMTVPRRAVRSNGSPVTVRVKELNPWVIGNYGHLFVKLYKEPGKGRTIAVHRIVLEAFKGPCPEGMESCHNDGNSQNNWASNLRWDSRQANMDDREKHGKHVKGKDSYRAKLTDEDIPVIREMLRADTSRGVLTRIAEKFKVNPSAIWYIKTGQTWKHIP